MMLMPINTINQTNYSSKIIKTNNNVIIATNIPAKSDKFEKNNITFQGRNLAALKQTFEDAVVADVKRSLTKGLESWKESLYNTKNNKS